MSVIILTYNSTSDVFQDDFRRDSVRKTEQISEKTKRNITEGIL